MADQTQQTSTAPAAGGRVDSEVGRLRSVMLHRPGGELSRLTPRNNDRLLFDGVPWVARAQEEHDAFAEALTSRGVQVRYLTDLLTEALADPQARRRTIAEVLADPVLGKDLGDVVGPHLEALAPADLTSALITGIAPTELPGGTGLAFALMPDDDFVVPPLPNVLFTRDSSVWVADRIAVTSMTMPARHRESTLTRAIWTHHPDFAGTEHIYDDDMAPVEGGDVLLMAPGVIAIGVGERTTPSGAEQLARNAFAAGIVHTVLAVPVAQDRATMHLDTVCTMVDVDTMIVYPNIADSLVAFTITAPDGADAKLRVSRPEPFLPAAAKAMGIERIRTIDTGLDPVTAEREQWDDGNNTLCIAPRLAVAYERNRVTNAALEAAGIEVVRIAGSELGSGRGGPRCMSCPIVRESTDAS